MFYDKLKNTLSWFFAYSSEEIYAQDFVRQESLDMVCDF